MNNPLGKTLGRQPAPLLSAAVLAVPVAVNFITAHRRDPGTTPVLARTALATLSPRQSAVLRLVPYAAEPVLEAMNARLESPAPGRA